MVVQRWSRPLTYTCNNLQRSSLFVGWRERGRAPEGVRIRKAPLLSDRYSSICCSASQFNPFFFRAICILFLNKRKQDRSLARWVYSWSAWLTAASNMCAHRMDSWDTCTESGSKSVFVMYDHRGIQNLSKDSQPTAPPAERTILAPPRFHVHTMMYLSSILELLAPPNSAWYESNRLYAQ